MNIKIYIKSNIKSILTEKTHILTDNVLVYSISYNYNILTYHFFLYSYSCGKCGTSLESSVFICDPDWSMCLSKRIFASIPWVCS